MATKYLDLDGLKYFQQKLSAIGGATLTESRYSYTTTATQVVSFTIPDFSSATCTLDVYINGLYCVPTVDYTLNGNVLTMTKELDAGQPCHFVVRKVS